MEKFTLKINSNTSKSGNFGITTGVVNSGNLEILINRSDSKEAIFDVITTVPGFKNVWNFVLEDFASRYDIGGLHFILHDSGATPAVVSLRLRQAYEKFMSSTTMIVPENCIYLELNARERIFAMTDQGSFMEFLPPSLKYASPHLAVLDLPTAFDDGAIIGKAKLAGMEIFIASQNYAFMGGAVGEINGAKIAGLCLKALKERPKALVLLLDSGGVRLQEANAGEIAISEIIASLMILRSAGIAIYGVVAGRNGAFGGVGIISQCLSGIIVTENARTGISGPEVIEAVMGTDEYDASDRALVWRTCGGRERATLRDGIYSIKDVSEIKKLLANLISGDEDFSIQHLKSENALLHKRLELYGDCIDGIDIWSKMGIQNAKDLPDLTDEEFISLIKKGNIDG